MAGNGMPDYIFERAKQMIRNGARHQFDAMAVPALTLDEAMRIFYDAADFAAMKRMGDLAAQKRNSETLRIITPVNGGNATYNIDVTIKEDIGYLLPDHFTRPIDWDNPVIERLRTWAEWRYETAKDWGRVLCAVQWFRENSATTYQLKAVWPDFIELLYGVSQHSLASATHDVKQWCIRFKHNSGYARRPLWITIPPFGGRPAMPEIRNTVQKIKLLTPPDDDAQDDVKLKISDTGTTGLVLLDTGVKIRSPYSI